MRFLIILVLTIVTILTNAEKRSTCREPVVFKNFDPSRILGHWYQYSRYSHDFEEGCDCFTTELVPISKDSIHLLNCCQMTQVSNVTQTCEFGVNKIRFLKPETKEAMFSYKREGTESTVESLAWIIDTDYDTYSIIAGCDQVTKDEEREIFWIYTREKETKETEREKFNNFLKTHNFDKDKIIKQIQSADVCTSTKPTKAPSP